jgi:hypothetical protein
MLQRTLLVGYALSGRLLDELARLGIISGNEGTKARKTLITKDHYLSYLEQGNHQHQEDLHSSRVISKHEESKEN